MYDIINFMKTKALYISAQEKNAGTLFVSMGMMEILKRNIHRVAFFRPIIFKHDQKDGDISFMKERYSLDIEYEDCYGFDVAYVEEILSAGKLDELINELIAKYKKLEDEYDFVLCEGIHRAFLSATIDFDINLKLAQNFGIPYINIISGKNFTPKEIYEDILIEHKNVLDAGCSHFATFVNRLGDDKLQALEKTTKKLDYSVYLSKEVAELDMPTILDVMESLDTKEVFLISDDKTRLIRGIRVAALGVNNFLNQIKEGDFIVVAADRSEIILALISSIYSKNFPNISGIIFPFHMPMHENIRKLISGLENFNIPILSVQSDTYETAQKLSNIRPRIRVTSDRKIALALGLFNASVDTKVIEKKIANSASDVITPMMFEYKLFETARSNKKRIVLPEGEDERVLRAAEIILHRNVADIIFLANEETFKENYLRLGLDLSKASVVQPCRSELMEVFVERFYEMRKAKGLTLAAAQDAMTHFSYFATMMVHLGYADGMVSGASHSTADTIRPALQIIKTKPGISIVSSVFFMCLKTKVLVYGDCAVNQDPNAQELAQIALSSAETAEAFGIVPKVAMLSYSTGESGSGADVEKVREATNLVKEKNPLLAVEGPIQYDAAIDKAVALTKLPNSKVAGEATVFVFPDLNTGNNTYKAVQRSSDAIAIGPILQGLNKPINDLSRGCLVADIVNTIAITAIQAGQES